MTTSSVARNSLIKLIANGSRQVLGLATGVMTARLLGPYDKGTLSTLFFTAHVLLFYTCSMGLGDASIILAGRKRFSLQEAVSGSALPLLAGSVVGIGALWVVGAMAQWSGIVVAVTWTGAGFVLFVYTKFLMDILVGEERFLASAAVTMTIGTVSAAMTWLMVAVFDRGLTGAAVASTLGFVSGFVICAWCVRRSGIRWRVRLDLAFVREALPMGLGIQLSFLMIVLSERFDQLMVYSLAGPPAAGIYSVALTVGQLATFIPVALSSASFPRLARLEADEVAAFTMRLTRIGLASAILSAGAVFIAAPVVVPLAWGRQYAGAVAPAMMLAIGALIWSCQWLLARAASARGQQRLLLISFSVTFVVMLGLDYLLIDPFGLMGAAVASLAASIAGLLVCVSAYHRSGHEVIGFLPRYSDFASLLTSVKGLWARADH